MGREFGSSVLEASVVVPTLSVGDGNELRADSANDARSRGFKLKFNMSFDDF